MAYIFFLLHFIAFSESELGKLKKKLVNIHEHKLKLLMIKVFQTKNNLNQTSMESIFTKRNIVRGKNNLQLPSVRTTTYGIDNFQYVGHYPDYRRKLWISTHYVNSKDIEIIEGK